MTYENMVLNTHIKETYGMTENETSRKSIGKGSYKCMNIADAYRSLYNEDNKGVIIIGVRPEDFAGLTFGSEGDDCFIRKDDSGAFSAESTVTAGRIVGSRVGLCLMPDGTAAVELETEGTIWRYPTRRAVLMTVRGELITIADGRIAVTDARAVTLLREGE